MAPGDFEALSARRARRARRLAGRHRAAREALGFLAVVFSLQARIAGRERGDLPKFLDELVKLLAASGTATLRDAASALDEAACRRALEDYRLRIDTASPASFVARVLLQPWAATAPLEAAQAAPPSANLCPRCSHAPQVAVLRPQGEGRTLALVCSLCLHEWSFPRGRCVACGEGGEESEGTARLAFYGSPELPHLRVQACDRCRAYLHGVDLGVEPDAVPDVDELAALPLDVWAREQGYVKVQVNLAGI